MSRLHGKVAVVTGAGSGIGREIATVFAQHGAHVVAVGRRRGNVGDTVAAISGSGGAAIAIQADVATAQGASQVLHQALGSFGKIDVLINNAGAVLTRTSVLDCSESDWAATFDTNVRSALLCSKTLLPSLIKVKGNIVHIASVFALVGSATSAAYMASKGALLSLTRSMAVDFGPRGVRVNAICPAYVPTDMNKELLDNLRRTGRFSSILDRLPLGTLGETQDVALAALFLASDEARWITGIALPVDGGMTAGRA
jgi:NAD(P)-dependent dehydrogenase (short-subunit alcohol dehydrogenase family)